METSRVKKRAARACSFCRGRKVRCIVAGPTEACANCKYHEKQCTRTGIYPQSPTYTEAASTPKSSAAVPQLESGLAPASNQVRDGRVPSISLDLQKLAGPFPAQPPGMDMIKTPMSIAGTMDFSALSTNAIQGGPPPPFAGPQDTAMAIKSTCHPTYSFLRTPDLQGILSQDLTFLISQGCFMVPQRSALDEFMEQYFRHVHPMLPLLNEADVSRAYKLHGNGCDDEDKLSILVLQGILFTSCGFVSLETLSTLGFKTHQESKWAFYRRAKLLYDFGCESSAITKAQGALLLAQSHLIPRPLAGNTPFGSIWLSVAIHFARDANAHRYASYMASAPLDVARARKQQNTLKRLWWCCVICDRVFPLSSRRDIKITKSNFDFAGCPVLESGDLADETYTSDVYDPTTKTILAEVLQKFVELCVVLTDVLTVTSVLHSHPSWDSTINADKLNSSKEDIQQWFCSWSQTKSTIEERSRKEGLAGSSNASVTMTTRLLDMYYYSARQGLCHAEILQYSIAGSPCLIPYALEKSDELQNANSRVTECLVELNSSRATRWLPMTAIGCTALPLALHLIDVELLRKGSEQGPCSDTAALFANYKRSRLSNLSEAMDTYRPRYYIVDWVVKAVWHIVHLARQFLSSISAQNATTGLSPSSWTELLQLMPSSYLRLVITLEMSISHGKLPEESDFPPTLRGSAQLSLSVPDMGKFLDEDAGGRSVEERRTAERDEGRVAEVTGEGADLDYDFDLDAAMDFFGDDMSFETPQAGQGDDFVGITNPSVDPPLPSGVDDTSADLEAIFGGGVQAGDDFDEWATRVLGLDAGPF